MIIIGSIIILSWIFFVIVYYAVKNAVRDAIYEIMLERRDRKGGNEK